MVFDNETPLFSQGAVTNFCQREYVTAQTLHTSSGEMKNTKEFHTSYLTLIHTARNGVSLRFSEMTAKYSECIVAEFHFEDCIDRKDVLHALFTVHWGALPHVQLKFTLEYDKTPQRMVNKTGYERTFIWHSMYLPNFAIIMSIEHVLPSHPISQYKF